MFSFSKKTKKGFTLLEILFFVVLISLIFIAVAYQITYSLRATQLTAHKVLAAHYAEELQEWLKGEKEADWNTFNRTGSYCFNTSPIIGWGSSGTCIGSYTLGVLPNNIFRRYVTFTNSSSTQVYSSIVVEWKEGNNTLTAPINSVFTIWE